MAGDYSSYELFTFDNFRKDSCLSTAGFCFPSWKADKHECGGARSEGDDATEKRRSLNVNRLNDRVSEWYNWIAEWSIQ